MTGRDNWSCRLVGCCRPIGCRRSTAAGGCRTSCCSSGPRTGCLRWAGKGCWAVKLTLARIGSASASSRGASAPAASVGSARPVVSVGSAQRAVAWAPACWIRFSLRCHWAYEITLPAPHSRGVNAAHQNRPCVSRRARAETCPAPALWATSGCFDVCRHGPVMAKRGEMRGGEGSGRLDHPHLAKVPFISASRRRSGAAVLRPRAWDHSCFRLARSPCVQGRHHPAPFPRQPLQFRAIRLQRRARRPSHPKSKSSSGRRSGDPGSTHASSKRDRGRDMRRARQACRWDPLAHRSRACGRSGRAGALRSSACRRYRFVVAPVSAGAPWSWPCSAAGVARCAPKWCLCRRPSRRGPVCASCGSQRGPATHRRLTRGSWTPSSSCRSCCPTPLRRRFRCPSRRS